MEEGYSTTEKDSPAPCYKFLTKKGSVFFFQLQLARSIQIYLACSNIANTFTAYTSIASAHAAPSQKFALTGSVAIAGGNPPP